jgi:8-oxo-dGTP pyrophosphatase MutT (NUDIX family)
MTRRYPPRVYDGARGGQGPKARPALPEVPGAGRRPDRAGVASTAVELLPDDVYARSLNRKRAAAGVLFRDERGRVLLVETSYKTDWEIPGGVVEADEAPWTAAVREVREEIGLERSLGRLLVIDYLPVDDVMPEGLAFVWDGGVLSPADVAVLTPKEPEILAVRFVPAADIAERVAPALAARLAAAVEALATGDLALCEQGVRLP